MDAWPSTSGRRCRSGRGSGPSRRTFSRPKEARLTALEVLAREMMTRIGAIIPVTPVPLAAAALLSFGQTVVGKDVVLERMDQLRDRLKEVNGKVVRGGARIADIWDRAWRMLR